MKNSYSGFLKYSLMNRESKYRIYSIDEINYHNSILKKYIYKKRDYKKHGVVFISTPIFKNQDDEIFHVCVRSFDLNEEYISKFKYIYKINLAHYDNNDGTFTDKLKVYGVLKDN